MCCMTQPLLRGCTSNSGRHMHTASHPILLLGLRSCTVSCSWSVHAHRDGVCALQAPWMQLALPCLVATCYQRRGKQSVAGLLLCHYSQIVHASSTGSCSSCCCWLVAVSLFTDSACFKHRVIQQLLLRLHCTSAASLNAKQGRCKAYMGLWPRHSALAAV
jgi:hypothetical protein